MKSTGSVVPAKGHNDANGDGKCEDCGKEIGGGSQSGDKGNIFGILQPAHKTSDSRQAFP